MKCYGGWGAGGGGSVQAISALHFLVSGLVERRLAPRRGFHGECCQPTALHRQCRQPNDKMITCRRCWPFESGNTMSYEKFGADGR